MTKAKLIKLVNEVVEGCIAPEFRLGLNGDFKERQDSPIIEYFGFDDKLNESFEGYLIRETALYTLESSLKDLNIINYNYKTIKELEKGLEEKNSNLKRLGFKNYHAFWTKDYWNIKKSGALCDMYSLLAGGLLSYTGNPIEAGVVATVGEVVNEVIRRVKIKSNKEDIKEIQRRLDTYDTIKSNIMRATTEVIDVPEAREIWKNVEKVSGISPYVELNINNINKDLIKAYKKYL